MSDMQTGKLRDAFKHSRSAMKPTWAGESSALVWWTIVLAAAAWGANAITLWAVHVQQEDARQQRQIADTIAREQRQLAEEEREDARKLLSAQLSSELDKQFDSPAMRRSRKRFATMLKKQEEPRDFRVLDFLDTVAFYVHTGALDAKTAYWGFHFWVERYWLASRFPMTAFRAREKGKDYYLDLGKLYAEMRKMDAEPRGGGRAEDEPSAREIGAFLDDEAALGP